jgi:hypothetical protein
MWLITNCGFFSVVQKPGEQQLTVRARAQKDLEVLRDRYLPQLGEIVEGGGTDYQYRARVSRTEFAEAMKMIAMDINYSNFKNSVAKNQGHKRANIYHDLWHSLWGISKEE